MSSEVLIQEEMTEVAGLLIPLHEKQLILPNVTVAEIIPYQAPASANNGADWLLGQIEWRNIDIPVLSYEVLNGGNIPPVTGARIAVINGTGQKGDLPFYAILIQGIPKLTHIQEKDVVEVEAMHSGPYDEMCVSLSNEQAMIPNLEMIENALLKYIG